MAEPLATSAHPAMMSRVGERHLGRAALPTGRGASRRHLEPCVRFSRTRLSSRWFYRQEDGHAAAWAAAKENNPRSAKKALGQR